MPFTAFHDRFPDIAEKEVRNLTILNDPEIPEGTYSLVEFYCDEPDCDCRRVMLNIVHWQKKKIVAVIAYGWESKAFYARWLGRNDPKTIGELQGPILNAMSRQSRFAPLLLERVQNYALRDKKYIKRLERHYQMFRKSVEQDQNVEAEPEESWFRRQISKFTAKPATPGGQESKPPKPTTPTAKVGRNAPCPCGSGKKYKKCCGR